MFHVVDVNVVTRAASCCKQVFMYIRPPVVRNKQYNVHLPSCVVHF